MELVGRQFGRASGLGGSGLPVTLLRSIFSLAAVSQQAPLLALCRALHSAPLQPALAGLLAAFAVQVEALLAAYPVVQWLVVAGLAELAELTGLG